MTGGEGRPQEGVTGGAGGSGKEEREVRTQTQTEALTGAMKEVALSKEEEGKQREEENTEGTDSAFEEEWSDTWLSPGITRQNSCLESVPEHDSLSRRSSLLDEELKETLMRRHSKDYRSPLSRRGSAFDDSDAREPLGRRDSLLEAVLAAKKGGWRGLVRTDSVESGASVTSSVSSLSSDGSGCPCDDCFLGLTDLLLSQPPAKKKVRGGRGKVMGVMGRGTMKVMGLG